MGTFLGVLLHSCPSPFTLRVTGTAAAAGSAYTWGGSAVAAIKTDDGYFSTRPLEFGVGYRRIDLVNDGIEDRNRIIVTGKHSVLSDGRLDFAMYGESAHTLDVQRTWKAGLATSVALLKAATAGDPAILVGATGGLAGRVPEGGGSSDAGTLAIGVEYRRTSETRLKLDYTLENDLVDEDDFSLVFQQVITPALAGGKPITLVAGAGKHRVVLLTLVATL